MAGEVHTRPSNETAPVTDKRPNIILFLVDDMGWQDTSLPFWTQRTRYNDTYHTPNMERLAKQGKMFTQAYACSISSPTRVSLFTGMNAARHRVTSWTLRKNTTHEQPDSVMIYPEWNVNGICQEPGVERTTQVTSLDTSAQGQRLPQPSIAAKPTSELMTRPEPIRMKTGF